MGNILKGSRRKNGKNVRLSNVVTTDNEGDDIPYVKLFDDPDRQESENKGQTPSREQDQKNQKTGQREQKVPKTTSTAPRLASTTSVKDPLPSPTELTEDKVSSFDAKAQGFYCRKTLDEYQRESRLKYKSSPGLIFQNVPVFRPLGTSVIVTEELDSIQALGIRLRDLQRTLAHDQVALERLYTVSNKTLSFPSDYVEELTQLSYDDRCDLLEILKEMDIWDKQHQQQVKKSHQYWTKLKIAVHLGGLHKDRLSGKAEKKETSPPLAESRVSHKSSAPQKWDLSKKLTDVLSAYHQRTGWQKLAATEEQKANTAKQQEEKDQKYENKYEDNTPEEPKLPLSPRLEALEKHLRCWLGVETDPLEVYLRLYFLREFCEHSNRLDECLVHLAQATQLARQVLAEFKMTALKNNPAVVQAVCSLAAAQDKLIIHTLLGLLIDGVKGETFLNTALLEGLAQVMQYAREEDVTFGDLQILVKELVNRCDNFSSAREEDIMQLVQTIGAVVSSMALYSQQQAVRNQTQAAEAERKAQETPKTQESQEASPPDQSSASVLNRAYHWLNQKKKQALDWKDQAMDRLDQPDRSGSATLSKEKYAQLSEELAGKVIKGVQERFKFKDKNQLKQAHPEIYFGLQVIQQAWLRVMHEEEKQSDKLVKGITQFFGFLESAKNTVTDFSVKSLMEAGQQLAEIIALTPLGDKIKDYLTDAEAKPQVWFEQYLILKTLADTEQLAVLEERLVSWVAVPPLTQAKSEKDAKDAHELKEIKETEEIKEKKEAKQPLKTPERPVWGGALFQGLVQLLRHLTRSESPAIREPAIQFLKGLLDHELWAWPKSWQPWYAAWHIQWEKEYPETTEGAHRHLGDRLRKDVRAESQALLRRAHQRCREEYPRYQYNDYCLQELRRAAFDEAWQDNARRYVPALAKSSLEAEEKAAQLFYPAFSAFLETPETGEAKETKGTQKTQEEKKTTGLEKPQKTRSMLILGDAGTGKSMFLRRNHLKSCERHFGRQGDRTRRYPLSLYLFLNQSEAQYPLEDYLRKQEFTESQIRALREGSGEVALLVHGDGYDEWSSEGDSPHLFAPKVMGAWATHTRHQFVITCRSQYLQGKVDYREYFTPPGQQERLSHWVITRLDVGGVERLTQYDVERQAAHGVQGWSKQAYLQQFKQSGIEELVRTPIILLMALKVLPVLQPSSKKDEPGKLEKTTTREPISRLMIYEAFVNQYIEEQRQKQIQRGVKNLGGLTKAAQPYAIQLALTFFTQDRAAISYQPRSPFSEFAPSSTAAFDRFFDAQRDSQNHRLAQVIPLQITTQENKREVTTVTQYSFIHKSILDYFTALGLFAEVNDLIACLEAEPPTAPELKFSSEAQGFGALVGVVGSGKSGLTPAAFLEWAAVWKHTEHYLEDKRRWQESQQQIRQRSSWNSRAINNEQVVIDFVGEILTRQDRAWRKKRADLREKRQQLVSSETKTTTIKELENIQEIKESKEFKKTGTQAPEKQAVTSDIYCLPRAEVRGRQSTFKPGDWVLVREDKTYTLYTVEEPGKLEAVELRVIPGLHAACQSLSRSSSLTASFGGKEEQLKSLIAVYRDTLPSQQFKQHLIRVMQASSQYPDLAQAAANMVTVLVRLGMGVFSALNFQDVRWPGADLMGSYWDRVDLTGADLTEASLRNVWMGECRLSGALLPGIQLGEFPSVSAKGVVKAMAMHPHDPSLMAITSGKNILIYDRITCQVIHILKGHTETVGCLRYAPDGRQLASGSKDTTVRLWDPKGEKESQVLAGHTEPVECLAYAPDGGQLASGSEDNTVRLWNPQGKKESRVLAGHTSSVNCLAYAPDGGQLASGSWDKTVRLWDPKEEKTSRVLIGHTDDVACLAYAPDGRQLASGSGDKTVRLWDPKGEKENQVLDGHTDIVMCLAYAPDGGQLASGSWDKTVRLWDPKGEKESRLLDGHTSFVNCLVYAPDGGQLASGSKDKTVRLWDPKGEEASRVLDGHTDEVFCLIYAPDGGQLASGSKDKTVRLWDPKGEKESRVLEGHTDKVFCLAYAPDGGQLASGSRDYTVRLWDPKGERVSRVLAGHTREVFCLAYAPDGGQLASGSWDKTVPVRLWDPKGEKESRVLNGHADIIMCLAYASDGGQLASGSKDKTVRLWDPKGEKESRVLEGHTDEVFCLAYAPDGGQLASGSKDTTVRLWNPKGEKESQVLAGHTEPVECLAYAPGGGQLASGSSDNTVRLWDPKGEKESQVLAGHTGQVGCLAYAPGSGQQLASGSADGTVRLWDPKGEKESRVLDGHTDIIWCLAYAPDGGQLASGSWDNTVRLWDTQTGICLLTWQAPAEIRCLLWRSDTLFIGCDNGIVAALRRQLSNRWILAWLHRGLLPAVDFPDCDFTDVRGLRSAQITLIEQRGGLHLPKITGIKDEKFSLSHPLSGELPVQLASLISPPTRQAKLRSRIQRSTILHPGSALIGLAVSTDPSRPTQLLLETVNLSGIVSCHAYVFTQKESVLHYDGQDISATQPLPDFKDYELTVQVLLTLAHSEALQNALLAQQDQLIAAECLQSNGAVDWEAWWDRTVTPILSTAPPVTEEKETSIAVESKINVDTVVTTKPPLSPISQFPHAQFFTPVTSQSDKKDEKTQGLDQTPSEPRAPGSPSVPLEQKLDLPEASASSSSSSSSSTLTSSVAALTSPTGPGLTSPPNPMATSRPPDQVNSQTSVFNG